MNLDQTGGRLVRKGRRVAHPHRIMRWGMVVKVCRGSCLVVWADRDFARPEFCSKVIVLD